MATHELPGMENPFRKCKDDLWKLYLELGIAPHSADLIEAALERGLIPDEVRDRYHHRGLLELAREVFKENDVSTGLARAKPLPSGRWQRLPLFTYPEADELVHREYAAARADLEEVRKYVNYFRDKFGDEFAVDLVFLPE